MTNNKRACFCRRRWASVSHFFCGWPASRGFTRSYMCAIMASVEREWSEAIFFYPAESLWVKRLGFVVVIGGN